MYPTLANSTPIRNTNTRSDQPGVHFNTNPVQHLYATTSDRGEQYEPPENDSILQGATSSPADQLHLPRDHVVAFAEKDCKEGEVLEICTMQQLEKRTTQKLDTRKKMAGKVQ